MTETPKMPQNSSPRAFRAFGDQYTAAGVTAAVYGHRGSIYRSAVCSPDPKGDIAVVEVHCVGAFGDATERGAHGSLVGFRCCTPADGSDCEEPGECKSEGPSASCHSTHDSRSAGHAVMYQRTYAGPSLQQCFPPPSHSRSHAEDCDLSLGLPVGRWPFT